MSQYVQSSMDRYVQRKSPHDRQQPRHNSNEIGKSKSGSVAELATTTTILTDSIGQPTTAMNNRASAANFKRSLAASFGGPLPSTGLTPQAKRKTKNDDPKTTSNTPAKAIGTAQLLTGTVARVLSWRRQYDELLQCPGDLYEICSRVLRISNGSQPQHRILLLRDDDAKLVLQAHYYEIDFTLPVNIADGSRVRCVGRFTSAGRFQAFKCRRVLDDDNIGNDDGLHQQQEGEFTVGRLSAALVARLASLTNFSLQTCESRIHK